MVGGCCEEGETGCRARPAPALRRKSFLAKAAGSLSFSCVSFLWSSGSSSTFFLSPPSGPFLPTTAALPPPQTCASRSLHSSQGPFSSPRSRSTTLRPAKSTLSSAGRLPRPSCESRFLPAFRPGLVLPPGTDRHAAGRWDELRHPLRKQRADAEHSFFPSTAVRAYTLFPSFATLASNLNHQLTFCLLVCSPANSAAAAA